jgi:DNA-binding GntR family transcriptional regulator
MEVVLPLSPVMDPDAAAALGLQFDEVFRIAYVRSHEAVPFCYTEVTIPPRLKPLLQPSAFLRSAGAQSDATILGILDREMASPVAGARQAINAVPAPGEIARQIGCVEGDPLLMIERVHFDGEGRPVERCVNYFNPDRYVYRLQLSRR